MESLSLGILRIISIIQQSIKTSSYQCVYEFERGKTGEEFQAELKKDILEKNSTKEPYQCTTY